MQRARSIDSGIVSTSESSTRASEMYVTPRRLRVTVTRPHDESSDEQKVYNRWSLSTKDDYRTHEHSPDSNYEAVDIDNTSLHVPAIVAPMPPTASDNALILIFERLDSIDLLSCARVCRRWHEIIMCRGDSVVRFWSNLSIKNKQIDNDVGFTLKTLYMHHLAAIDALVGVRDNGAISQFAWYNKWTCCCAHSLFCRSYLCC